MAHDSLEASIDHSLDRDRTQSRGICRCRTAGHRYAVDRVSGCVEYCESERIRTLTTYLTQSGPLGPPLRHCTVSDSLSLLISRTDVALQSRHLHLVSIDHVRSQEPHPSPRQEPQALAYSLRGP
jgi:hypothetical protein